MRKFFRFVFLFFLFLIFSRSYAWNALGHMVIANIAYQNLSPTAQTKIDAMTNTFAKEYPNVSTFNDLAPWPDTLHGQSVEMFTRWHYVGFEFKDGVPIKSNVDSDNAIWAILTLEPVLKNANANPFERARSLAFFVHIVGDLHQPLHAATRVSDAHPSGDQGGNLFMIQYPAGTIRTLHALWDNGCGFFSDDPTPQNIAALTNTIITDFPPASFGAQISDIDPNDWAQEDMKVAIEQVYNTLENQVPSTDYINSGKRLSEQRAALAGYRLAFLLNKLIG